MNQQCRLAAASQRAPDLERHAGIGLGKARSGPCTRPSATEPRHKVDLRNPPGTPTRLTTKARCWRIPLSAQMIGLRFTAAAQAAGVESRVTAHSGRVGLASELTSRGASTTDVMLAGNWKTSRMVAHYSAGATAERGAVARYL